MKALHGAAAALGLAAILGAQVPSNDECINALQVFEGVNPNPPGGFVGAQYALTGATTSLVGCAGSGGDVFFRYVAPCAGPVLVSLCPLTGLSPCTVQDPVLSVFDACGGAEIACNDDFCGLLPELTFVAVVDTTYFIRVAAAVGTPATGSFYVRVHGDFCLRLDSPLGASSIRIRLFSGPPNGAVLNFFTLFQGNYPNGFFFGIDPTYPEIVLQLQAAVSPFLVVLDASGGATVGPFLGAPPLTLYAVSLALNSLDQLFDASPPTTVTIP